MDATKRSDFDGPIVLVKILDDSALVVVDSSSTIKYIDKDTLKIKSGFKLNVLRDRFETDKIAFSTDGKNFVSLTQNNEEAKLYDSDRKKILSVMDRHHGEISCVAIDPKNRFSMSGGEDGKIFVVDIKSGQHCQNLPNHADTINDITFSPNAQLVATAGYDKKIALFNLVTMKQKFKLKAHNAPIVKMHFIGNNRLFSVDKRSNGIIWDVSTSKVITRLNGIHDDITKVTSNQDSTFLFLGSKLGYIMVYDLKSYELIDGRYLKFDSSITSLNFDSYENQLIVATEKGELLFYDIYRDEKVINDFLRQKKYAEVEDFVDRNPLLRHTRSYRLIEDIWDKTVAKAKEYFGNNDKARAIKMFDNFITIPKRKSVLNKMIKEYEEFEKLINYMKQGKIALAYGLVNKYPSYRDTKTYELMNKNWKKAFEKAQKYILQPKGYDKAMEILSPYRGISEKTVFIQGLMSNAGVHKRFQQAIAKKDFKLCYELLKKYPFLTEYAEYDALVKYSDTLYINAKEHINEGDTHSAIKLIKILLDFVNYKDEAQDMLKIIEERQRFFSAIENNDMITAYNILDTHDELQDTNDGIRIQKIWDEDIDKADEYASKGDIDGVQKVLDKYMHIESKIIAISTIVSWCYITQLQNSLTNNVSMKKIELGIKNYVLYFGLTEQIFGFYEFFKSKYSDSKLSLDSLKEGSIEKWRASMIVKSILD